MRARRYWPDAQSVCRRAWPSAVLALARGVLAADSKALACRTHQADGLAADAAPELRSLSPCLQVEVVAEVDGWLHCMASNGAKGLVPSSYVQLLGAGGSNGLQQQYSSAVSVHQHLCMLLVKLCL